MKLSPSPASVKAANPVTCTEPPTHYSQKGHSSKVVITQNTTLPAVETLTAEGIPSENNHLQGNALEAGKQPSTAAQKPKSIKLKLCCFFTLIFTLVVIATGAAVAGIIGGRKGRRGKGYR